MSKYKQKSKTTAVILACIFGGFCWLYTYKDDAWKFWLYLISLIVITMTYFLLIFIFNIGGYSNYIFPLYIIYLLINIGLYLWAIIDYSTTDKDYFSKY